MTEVQSPQSEADFAREVLRAESVAVAGIQIGGAFHEAVELIVRATADGRGSVVLSGLGKNSYIAQKLSATFASLATPSHFLHPTEAMHGDLGRIRRDDVVILLSFGGQTEEVVELAGILKQDGVSVIAIVGSPETDLARLATVTLCVGPLDEACPHNLAPTASTTAMLALGDAVALCVGRRNGFDADDFRKVHPGGNLGRQLMAVVDAMRFKVGENLPLIEVGLTVEQAVAAAETPETGPGSVPGLRRAGAFIVIHDDGRLAGIFSDADLRRTLIEYGPDAWHRPISELMTTDPRTLQADAMVRDAANMMREYRIDEIPVVDDRGKPLGLIDVQDLVALKVIEG